MNFIDTPLLNQVLLSKSYNPYLVVLSILIAVVSAYTSFGMSERIHASKTLRDKVIWNFFGSVSMGLGIWSMHFVASLALKLPVNTSFHLGISMVSVIPAVVSSSIVLWLMNTEYQLKHLLFSGVLLGAGISCMHFIGMSAVSLPANVVYLKPVFLLSLLIAVIMATVALKIKFDFNRQDEYQFISKKQCISAMIMGLAIAGMHYTAMEAVEFIPLADASQNSGVIINSSTLTIEIIIVILLVLTNVIVLPYALRFRELSRQNAESLKIAAIAFQTHEAIMVTDYQNNIVQVNNAFSNITQYTEAEAIGRNADLLNSVHHDAIFYEKFWNTIHTKGKWSGEIWITCKNGEEIPVWQTCTSVRNSEGTISNLIFFFSDITDYKNAEKEIEQLAFYDTLTELPNRRLLHERLEHELVIAKRYQRAGMLFFLDLDRFKLINDSLGHAVGDQLLIQTATRLQSLLRESDTAVRLGGDEFIVMVSAQDGIHMDLLEQSKTIAEKIIETINQPYIIENHELFVSTSIGITLYTGLEDESVDILLKRADTAMYQAKEEGRNTFRFYQQSMQDIIDSRLKIERHLNHAISRDELYIEFQPQLSGDNKIIGAEALIRWNNQELGMISPADFIPVAEETGYIVRLGEWIFDNVCQQINSWEEAGLEFPHIAVNISAKQFHHTDFVSMMIQKVYDHHLDPDKIILEITEGVFLGNIEQVIDKMHTLKQFGFKFSIDDFGIGYSSLTYLKRLSFDQLKIDQSFVQGLIDHPSDAAIVKAIIVMAKSLNLEVIAEGIETHEHLAYLSSFGCYKFQGYYFSKPLSPEKLSLYVEKHNNQSGKQ